MVGDGEQIVLTRKREKAIIENRINSDSMKNLKVEALESDTKKTLSWAAVMVEKITDLDTKTIDDNQLIDPNRNYPSFPSNHSKQNQPNLIRRTEELKKAIDEEYKQYGSKYQFKRDAIVWRMTLRFPGNPLKRDFMRRVFTVLRFGGFMYRTNTEWKMWSDLGIPIASALGHGGRVLIQLPPNQIKTKEYDHSFWNWLITGKTDGTIYDLVSIKTSGEECEEEGKIIFKRSGATHSVVHGGKDEIEKLPFGSNKYVLETRTFGISLRDSKLIHSSQYVLYHHRHWAMNVPLMGHGRNSFSGEPVSSNGEHGSLYLYYMSPSNRRCGGILIGLEGSEYGKHSQHGHKHGLSGDSASYSATFGYKWANKKDPDHSIRDIKGPVKTNGMFVDLTGGWGHLVEREKDWNDDWVMETSIHKDGPTTNPIVDDIDTFSVVDTEDRVIEPFSSEEDEMLERSKSDEDLLQMALVDKEVKQPVESIETPILTHTLNEITNAESGSIDKDRGTIPSESDKFKTEIQQFLSKTEFEVFTKKYDEEIKKLNGKVGILEEWNRYLLIICFMLSILSLVM
jgi:hypothetical protein